MEFASELESAARLQLQMLGSGFVLMIASVILACIISAFGRK